MDTINIIPISKPNVLKSILEIASSCGNTFNSKRMMAPTNAILVLCIFSETIMPYVIINIRIASNAIFSMFSTSSSNRFFTNFNFTLKVTLLQH